MGISPSNAINFRWIDRYEVIDLDNNDKILKLMSRVGESEYIGKQITCIGTQQIRKTEEMIDKKVLSPSPFLVRLVKVGEKVQQFNCTENKTFCLVFEKPYKTLKQDTIYRKLQNSRFREADIECILSSCLHGLLYLKDLDQVHGKISYSNIFIKEDQTIVLNDPWLTQDESDVNKKLQGNVYPSPEKILFQNGYIENYDIFLSDLFSLGVMLLDIFFLEHMDILYERGYRRLIENRVFQMINKFKSKDLRNKLQILLSHQPAKRGQIFKFYEFYHSNSQKFISLQKQSFKKQYIQDSLVTSQVKTVKINKKDLYQNQFQKNNVSSSRNPSENSSFTIPEEKKIIGVNIVKNSYLIPLYPQQIQQNYTPPLRNKHIPQEYTFNRNEVRQRNNQSISSISKNQLELSRDNIQLQLLEQFKKYANNCAERKNQPYCIRFKQPY